MEDDSEDANVTHTHTHTHTPKDKKCLQNMCWGNSREELLIRFRLQRKIL